MNSKGKKIEIVYWPPEKIRKNREIFNCPRITDQDRKRICLYLKKYENAGFPANKEKFRYLEDRIWEIKPTTQLRLLGFFDNESRFVIVLCRKKKASKLPRKDIELAEKLRESYYEQD